MNSASWRRSAHGCRSNDERSDNSAVFRVKNGSWQCKSDISVVSAPQVVGYFSVDGNRTYLPNSSNLSYYTAPPQNKNVRFDLNQGIENVRRKSPSANDEKINHLLKWIKLNYKKIQAPCGSKRWIQPDFVCFRGLLTLILCTPYSPRDRWIICASKWRGSIYLCAFKTLEEKKKNANLSEDTLKFMSWGFKFEKYILADAPDESPDTSKTVDEGEEFCCLFKRRFGDHVIFYGAEMDGISSKTKLQDPLPLEELQFVELKTSRVIEHDGQERNFRKFKLLKWWAQSYLVGIEKLLCGFRDDRGIVRDLESLTIPEIIQRSKAYWDAKSCVHFCQDFLSHVSKTVTNECDQTIYKFERIPFGDILTTEMSPTSEYAFMELSYLERTE